MTSTEYYRTHPAARKRKQRYDAKLNSSDSQTKKRVESNRARRRARRRGQNIEGKDWDHAVGRFVSVKTNRGRRGEGNR